MKNGKKIISLAMASAMILSALPLSAAAETDDTVFVTMNIPYNTFYQADIKNSVEVDAVSSATSSKWKTFAGTYFVSDSEGDGGKILGVSFPVEVKREDYSKLKTVEKETDDYYFTDYEGTPSVYKTLTVDNNGDYSFSTVKGDVKNITDSKYTFTTDSKYGDYQFDFSDVTIDGTVYGIIVTADDGTQYGLRHLENIWKKTYEFAWSSGVKTTESHGNTLAPEHYKSIAGSTIKEVTYITDKGISTYEVDSYVPVKTTSVVSVEDAKVSDASTTVTVTPELPEDYNASYSVEGLETEYADGKLSYKDAKAGSYTLNVSDADGKYAPISTTFTLSADKVPAEYDNENKQLVAVKDSEDDFKAYLKNISNVKVGETDYTASGKRGLKIISTEDGKIDLEAASTNGPVFDFANNDSYNLTVSATGYPDLSFELSVKSNTVFVTMNIPYSTFYKADLKNDVEVDAVSSATERLWGSFDGTYFVSNGENAGGKILGVSFPVEVNSKDYDKLKKVEDASADYYFTALEETPVVYKTLTIDDNGNYTFSEVKSTNDVTTTEGTKYTLTTESVWGDYLFEFSDATVDGTVYGIIVTADDGSQYGLRHLENIWKKTYEFSWGSGIKKTEAKGNVLSYEHYQALAGDTITDVTYITDKGIYSYPVNQYVPVKATTVVSVEDTSAASTSTKATFTPELPADYKAVYSVAGLDDVKYSDGVLSYANAKAGSYTLTVSDSEGKYADILSTFTLSTDKLPAEYDNENKQLVAVQGSEDDFKAYLKNLTNVKVDDTDYSASGHGAISIIDSETGKIDLEAASRTGAIFDTENKDTFNLTVSAAGYPDLTFEISLKDNKPGKTYIIGDVNGDGEVTSADSLSILRASVKLEDYDDVKNKIADVNDDKDVNSADSLIVLRYSVKLVDNDIVGTTIEIK